MLTKTSHLMFCGIFVFALLCSSVTSQDQNSKKVKIIEDPESEKVTYKTTIIGTELADIIWCGSAKDSVLVVTEGGVVYYSNNGGLEWKKLKDIFQKAGQKVSEDEDVGIVNSLLQSPVDSQLIFFLGSEGVHWYTEDCGKNIKALDTGRNIRSFQFHPTKRDWVLASAFTDCDEESNKPCKTSQELYLSQDLGKTWTFLIDFIIQFSWAIQDSSFLQTIPEQRIVVTKDLRTEASQKIGPWAEQVQMMFTDDFFKTKKTVLNRGQKFLITKDFFFAVKVVDEDAQDVSLYVGDPKLKNYKFQGIRLPTKDKLFERSYIILDSSEGQIFLHINHENVRSKYGNVYISDSTGIRYSLSLKNNVRADDLSDFERVNGLEGIYFANVYDSQIVSKVQNEMDSGADVPNEKNTKKGKGKEAGSKPVSKRIQDLDEYKQTRITFDKGGMWEPLTPPKYDALGELIECEDKGCSLHLHSISNSNFGPFYSTDNSLGLLLGTGNVGKYLSNKEDEVNTYLSRDGGLSWYEIKKGSHTYEIGDHGSILVVASDQKASQYVYYSWNEGLSWSILKVSETPIEITNIIIEPSNTAQKFILYGRTTTSTSDSKGVIKTRKGMLIGIDFSSLHERTCELPDKPDDSASDYETWTPNGYLSESCLMGHKITYSRRKRSAECFNPQELDKLYSFKNCSCTEEDWECDLGYERKNNACVLTKGKEPSYEPPEECDDYFTISSGYRKVAGNTCEGGVNHDAFKFACPSKIFSKKNGTMLLGLALVGLVAWIIMKKGDKLAHLLRQTTSSGKSLNRKGFAQLNQDETTDTQLEDHEDLSAKFRFDKNDKDIQLETKKDEATGKRMAQRKGIETASKNIPAVNKPQQSSQQLGDDDEDDIANFDARI